MSKQYEIDAAYFQGLREGFDPEVAEDLGIPPDSETAIRHMESAKLAVGALSQVVATRPASSEHEEWIDSMHLTHPSSEGPLQFATPKQRQYTTDQVKLLKAQVPHKQ